MDYKKKIREAFYSLSEEEQDMLYKLLENYLCVDDETRKLLMEDPERTIREFIALYGASEE